MILEMTHRNDKLSHHHKYRNKIKERKQNNTIVYTKLRSYITLYNTYFL